MTHVSLKDYQWKISLQSIIWFWSCYQKIQRVLFCIEFGAPFRISTTSNYWQATELRLRTALELVEHKNFYVDQGKASHLDLCSEDIEKTIEDCPVIGNFSSPWSMHAASSVVCKPITSIYPVVNGPMDKCIVLLNRTFQPRVKSVKHPLKIMWSGPMSRNGTWVPNHRYWSHAM